MIVAKKLMGSPIFHLETGRRLGTLEDLYFDESLSQITGLFLGSDGILARTPRYIPRGAVHLISEDSVFVVDEPTTDSVPDSWVKRSQLTGREITTGGGTKVGTLSDVILSTRSHVVGFTLAHASVTSPVAERGAFGRNAMLMPGADDAPMTIDLPLAESQNLAVESHLFSADTVTELTPAANENGTDDAVMTPYTRTNRDPIIHYREDEGLKSPYVTTDAVEQPTTDSDTDTPYTSVKPDIAGVEHRTDEEGYKSPYVSKKVGA